MVGAILTQNTNWSNVERAISTLKEEGVLDPYSLYKISKKRLAGLIRPAGYFNIKAGRLKSFIRYFVEKHDGDAEKMKGSDMDSLRAELLEVNGIGPETADSILLYALDKPVFVIDAYTKRVLHRHGLIDETAGYSECQALFHKALPEDVKLFNEYHALFVRVGKEHCRPKPRCETCPLNTPLLALTKCK
ncbi:MAG: endonuclease III domain-containing protein [Nitrospirae bacterium]|nr:MAG: endonuclease III domain-containing protein [Nitrospirota bacterium]